MCVKDPDGLLLDDAREFSKSKKDERSSAIYLHPDALLASPELRNYRRGWVGEECEPEAGRRVFARSPG